MAVVLKSVPPASNASSSDVPASAATPAAPPAVDVEDGPDPEVLAALAKAHRRTRIITSIMLVLAVLAIGVGAWAWRLNSIKTAWVYDTKPMGMGTIPLSVTATGTVEPKDAVDVGSDVSGRIKTVLVDVNQHVKAGQVMAQLDPEVLELAVRQATAAVGTARANYEQSVVVRDDAVRTLARVKALFKRGAAPQQDADTADTAANRLDAAVRVAAASLENSKAALASARANRNKTDIRAPIAGIVLTRNLEVGQVVVSALQAAVLFRVAADLTRLEVRASIDEADIAHVKEGQSATFTVSADAAREYNATVRVVSNAPKMAAQVVTYEARLDVDNTDLSLRPGMTATVHINVGDSPASLLAPAEALRFSPPVGNTSGMSLSASVSPRVYLLQDGVPVARDVDVGASDGTRTIVHGDLKADDVVIVSARRHG